VSEGLKYTIEVDRKNCIACGVCYNTDPNHFEGDSEGISRVLNGSTKGVSTGIFDDGLIDDVRRVESSCPAKAITVTE
jgi:ferredoxin